MLLLIIITMALRFQFLIGRLQTLTFIDKAHYVVVFQFLIGRLQTNHKFLL